MTAMHGDTTAATIQWKVWEQAWSHSRHLETMRSQYLGFFFTIVIGVAAFAGQEIADRGLNNPGSVIVLAILSFGLNLLSGFLLLAVARVGDVLCIYGEILRDIQGEAGRAGSTDWPSWLVVPTQARILADPAAKPPSLRTRFRSTQTTAEYVLLFGIFGFPALLAVTAVRSVTTDDIPTTTAVVCFVALAFGAAVTASTLWAWRQPADERQRNDFS